MLRADVHVACVFPNLPMLLVVGGIAPPTVGHDDAAAVLSGLGLLHVQSSSFPLRYGILRGLMVPFADCYGLSQRNVTAIAWHVRFIHHRLHGLLFGNVVYREHLVSPSGYTINIFPFFVWHIASVARNGPDVLRVYLPEVHVRT